MIAAAMPDGFPTLMATMPGGGPGVLFEEVRVKPPGVDGRQKIDTSGMRNTSMVTSWPRALKDVTDVTLIVAWDPSYWNTLMTWVNGGAGTSRGVNVFLLNYPATMAGARRQHIFYGSINKFEPSEFVEGERPTATMTIVIHNVLPSGFLEHTPSVFTLP